MDCLRQRVNARIRQEGGLVTASAAFRRRRQRRGVATLWLIVALPVLLLLLCTVIEIGNIWLARVELENSLESAALAAVKEWADAGGGDTQTARLVGVQYAAANTVTGTPVALLDNYNPGNTNQNNVCSGNLIFGAITNNAIPWVFNAGIQPSCGLGEVLFDATSGASMQDRGSWGINFHPPIATTPAGLTISRVVIDLRVSDPDADFSLLGSDPPIVSDRLAGSGEYAAPNSQDDTFGLDSGALTPAVVGTTYTWTNTQVRFTYDTTLPGVLVIEFFDSNGDPNDGERGFEPGDRIRFGARVVNLGQGNTNEDGDGVGDEDVQVTVTFAINAVDQAPPSVGTFFDSDFGNQCPRPGARPDPPPYIDPCIAQPGPPYYVLPPADANGNGNDDQSYVVVGGAGGNALAVRAQATADVNSVCCRVGGLTLPIFQVSACATARDDCTAVGPHLIRVRQENYICPGP